MTDLIEAKPHLGYLVHASNDHRLYAREGNPKSYGSRRLIGGALCGVRGRDAWGGGGMLAVVDQEGNDIPFDPTKAAGNWDADGARVYSRRCARCTRLARALLLSKGTD